MDGNNSAVQEDPGDEDLDQPLSRLGIVKFNLKRHLLLIQFYIAHIKNTAHKTQLHK